MNYLTVNVSPNDEDSLASGALGYTTYSEAIRWSMDANSMCG